MYVSLANKFSILCQSHFHADLLREMSNLTAGRGMTHTCVLNGVKVKCGGSSECKSEM